MSWFEKKFGRFAIRNLTVKLVIIYAVGTVVSMVAPDLMKYLYLDPGLVMKGEVWRLFTWLFIPTSSHIFMILVIYIYYWLGTVMERTIGTYKYNVYLLRGMILMVVTAFIAYWLVSFYPELIFQGWGLKAEEIKNLSPEEREYFKKVLDDSSFVLFSVVTPHYINLSIFLAYTICYPEQTFLLYFIVPIKAKWLGLFDFLLLCYSLYTGNFVLKLVVLAVLLNVIIFYCTQRDISYLKPTRIKRKAEFQRAAAKSHSVSKHKCAICGQTSESNPDLEFRFCSKCNGNYEYCMEHLYTHEHIK